MAIFALPLGSEVAISIYLTGVCDSMPVNIVLTLGGMKKFSDDLLDRINVERLVASYNLYEIGNNWRVMTNEEIFDYKADNKEN